MACKKVLMAIFSIMALLISIVKIGVSVGILVRSDPSGCKYVSRGRGLALGIFTLVFSGVRIFCACAARRTKQLLQRIYALLLVALAIAFVTAAAFVITAQSGSAPGKYPSWLRERLVDGKNWASFKTCVGREQVCKDLPNSEANNFKGSCCRPPSECGNASSGSPDCSAWSSNTDKMCYDCDACKAKYLEKFAGGVRVFIVEIFAVLLVFLIGMCGFERERQAKNLPYGQLPQATVPPTRPSIF